jgi:hypothetical protein
VGANPSVGAEGDTVNIFYTFIVSVCLQGLNDESFTYREICANKLISIGCMYDIRQELKQTLKKSKSAEVRKRCKNINYSLVLYYIDQIEKRTIFPGLGYKFEFAVSVNGKEERFETWNEALEAAGGCKYHYNILHVATHITTKEYVDELRKTKKWDAETLLKHLETKIDEDKPNNPIPFRLK